MTEGVVAHVGVPPERKGPKVTDRVALLQAEEPGSSVESLERRELFLEVTVLPSPQVRFFRPLVLAAALASACGSSGGSVAPDPGPTALFAVRPDGDELHFTDVPFPSDGFLIPDEDGFDHLTVAGLDAVVPQLSDVLRQGLAQLDGFGLSTAIYFRFDGDIDPASLPATVLDTIGSGASVFLMEASSDAGPHPKHPIELRWDPSTRTLALLPEAGVPLRASTRYAAVVTRAVRGTHPETGAMGPVAPSPDFLTAVDKRRDPKNTTLDRIQSRYEDAVTTVLDETGLSIDDLACLTVFTTQRTARDLTAVRAQLERRPAPVLDTSDPLYTHVFSTPEALDELLGVPETPRAGLDNPGGVVHDAIGAVVSASFLSDWYKSPARGLAERVVLARFDDDRFVDVDGEPVRQRQDRVPVTVVLPRSPAPPSGYPVVIYQHGLGGSRESMFGLANTFAAEGYATVGIDAVAHGLRYQTTDAIHNFTGAPGPDGFAEVDGSQVPVGFFEGFLDLLAIRDNFRQSAVDLLELVRLIRNPALDLSIAPGSPRLDPSHLTVVGNSLGAIMSALFAAVDPYVEGAILNVGGGGLANYLLVNSPVEGGENIPLIATLFGLDLTKGYPDRWMPFVNVAQTIVEAGDSLAFAPHLVNEPLTVSGFERNSPKSVMLIEAMGDEVVPNVSNEALARAIGLDQASPFARAVPGLAAVPSVVRGNRQVDGRTATAALVQQNPASHGANLENQAGRMSYQPGFPFPGSDPFPRLTQPVAVAQPLEETQGSVLRFVRSIRAGLAEIEVAAEPEPY
ncbi:MAG: hypothetical protein IPK07_32275 [Deltaproteobacteria bacterium]|nr:hypothetical protein [Deltaproteobacteria bacterium]